MWKLISAVLGIIVIYLLIRLIQQGSGMTESISSKKKFNGFETHAIIVMDDDINSMETIVNTLVRVIGISEKQSINLMFRIHKEGIAIVWTGTINEAEHYLQNMRLAGLRCFLVEILSNNL